MIKYDTPTDPLLDQQAQDQNISTLAKGASISYVGKFLGRAILAVIQIVLARTLGPGLFGIYAIGWSILRIGNYIALSGLDKGVIHFGARYWQGNTAVLVRVIRKSLLIVLVTAGTLMLLLFGLSGWLETVFEEEGLAPLLRIFAFGYPIWTATLVLAAATRVSKNMRFSILIEEFIFPLTFLVLLAIPVIFYSTNLQVYAAVHVGAFAVALGFGSFFLYRTIKKSPKDDTQAEPEPGMGDIFWYSLPTSFAGLLFVLTTWGNRLFIGFFRDSQEVGIFQAVMQMTILLTVTLNAIDSILSPMFADYYHRQDQNNLEETYRVGAKWGLYISVPLFFGVVFSAPQILELAYGSAYLVGASSLILLACAQLFNIATGSVGMVVVMTGHQKKWLWMTVVMFVINVGLNLYLIPRYGIVGAAIATGLPIVVMYSIGLWILHRYLKIWPYDGRFLKVVVAFLAVFLALALLSPILNSVLLVEILVNFATAALIFSAVIWLFGFDREDTQFFNQIKQRLGRFG